MNLINVKVSINNDDAPYYYDGIAKEYKDLIEYDYLDENFIYDKNIERITKTGTNNTVVVDFLNKEIIIKSKEKTFNLNFELLKKEITDNNFYYLYKIDKKKIEFILKKEV